MKSSTSRWLVAAAAVIAVAVGGVVWAAAGHDERTPAQVAELPLPPPLTPEDGLRLSADLRSGEPSRVAEAILMPSGTPIPSAAAKEYRQFRSIDIDVETFKNGSDRTATVAATVVDDHGDRREWRLVLVESGGRWLIAETV